MAGGKERGPSGSASAEIGKYLEILAKDPNSRVFAPLAEAYRKAGLLDDAVQTALEGLKVHPNYLGGRVALGRAYFEKKQLAEAAAEMQKVVRAAPDNLMAHKVLGHVAWEQGDLRSAETSFRMVLLLDPGDAEAKRFVDGLGGRGREETGAPARAAVETPETPGPAEVALPLEGLEPHRAASAAEIAIPIPVPSAAPPAEPEPPPPIGTPPLQPAPETPLALPEELSLEEISIDVPVPARPLPPEPVGPEPPPAGSLPPEPVPPEPPPAEAAPAAAVADLGEPELEVFAREPWGAGAPPLPAEPEPRPSPPSAADEDSPFEVFGRAKRGGPPRSTKGETEAFREIELEPTSHAPVGELEPEEPEGVFEIFTREPRIPEGEAARAGERREPRSEGASFREIELETTAHALPEGEAAEAPLPLEEEIPRIDLASEIEPERGVAPPPAAETFDRFAFPDEEPAPSPAGTTVASEAAPPAVAAEEAPEPAPEPEPVPSVSAAGPVEEPAGAPAGGRGIFDTETLAAIYTSQGFHARAAEIYRRLLAERPGDAELGRKLAEAEERSGSVPAAPPPPPPAGDFRRAGAAEARPAAPVPAAGGGEETTRRLEALMHAFRGKGRSS